MNNCEVVIINYKRSRNIAAIVDAFKRQTIPVTLTLCDVHPSDEYALSVDILATFDKVFQWRQNFGSYNRYIPTFGIQTEYVYFHDDDMLPGPRVIETFLRYASELGEFGVLGQVGRLFGNGIINQTDIFARNDPIKVDALVRGYFVRTRNLVHLFRRLWLLKFEPKYIRHDDLLLSMAMRASGLKNYAVPANDQDQRINAKELPADFSLHTSNPAEHKKTRQCVLSEGFFDSVSGDAEARDAGLLYLSIGDRRRLLNGALARTNKFSKLPVHVISNIPYSIEMTLVPNRHHNRWYKTSLLFYSPFSTSLLLDDDTRIEYPLNEELLSDAIGNADIAMARDYYLPTVGEAIEHFRGASWINPKEIDYMRSLGYDPAEPYFNSGVIIVKKTKATIELFLTWFREWNRYQAIDQLALFRAIKQSKIRVNEIDLRFNTPGGTIDRPAFIRHFYGHFDGGKLSAIRAYDEKVEHNENYA